MRMNIYSRPSTAYWNPPVDLQSGFRKPDSQYFSGLLKKLASALKAKSESQNKYSGMALGKVVQLVSVFIEAV